LDLGKNEQILRALTQARSHDELLELVQKPAQIYRLLVTLDSIKAEPPEGTVSRTIEIEGNYTLFDLHWEIQKAFGWDDDHLYSFYMSNRIGDEQSEYAGNPLGEDLESDFYEPPGSAAGTELRALELKKGKKFKYLFDYGDNLIHTLRVLDIHDRPDESTDYPRIVDKTGEPPPQYDFSEE
jgi:hypothetical protein